MIEKEILESVGRTIDTFQDIELNIVISDRLADLRTNINDVFISHDEKMQEVIAKMEKYEFELVSVEIDGMLFRRLIDAKDFVFIDSKYFDDVLKES